MTTYHQVVLRESISVTNDSDITDQSDVIACETDLQEMSCSCGDGFVQFGNNEECDDGNTDDTDFCSNTCQLNCQDGSECKVDTDC
ncbi:MAG: DUF4215 domain-containing protein [Candidatus Peribacteria bacterium]|nr:MAG: DUF4215 domain-containing protein [Candidatus Peribacteria bacterium]